MDSALLAGLAGAIVILLILLGLAASIGAGLGRSLERRSARRDVRSIEAVNLVAESLAQLGNRDAQEALGLLLKKTAEGLEARAGCILFATGPQESLKLVYALGVSDFAGIVRAANDGAFLALLKTSQDNIIADYLRAHAIWSPLGDQGGRAFIATLIGREHGWQALLALSWARPEEASEAASAVLHIGRYAGRVLAEMEAREERARDFVSLSAQLDEQENLIRQIKAIAHDAQQPLAKIPGVLFALEEEGNGNKILTRQAETEIEGLTMLSAGIMKTEIARREIEAEPVPVGQLLELVPSMMSGTYTSLLSDKNLRFAIDAPADLPPVLGERVSLIRVLNNLLANASKYNVPDGSIRLRVRRSGGEVVFVVENSGPAIPAEALPRLFEYGYRVQGSEKLARGRGVGLYSCKQIIDVHGGRIWAESEQGVNRFAFTVPVAAETG